MVCLLAEFTSCNSIHKPDLGVQAVLQVKEFLPSRQFFTTFLPFIVVSFHLSISHLFVTVIVGPFWRHNAEHSAPTPTPATIVRRSSLRTPVTTTRFVKAEQAAARQRTALSTRASFSILNPQPSPSLLAAPTSLSFFVGSAQEACSSIG